MGAMMSTSIQFRLNAIVPVILLCAVATMAQVPTNDCRGPIYEVGQVAVPAKITQPPEFTAAATNRGSAASVHLVPKLMGVPARVLVEAILCRTGVLTDIKVIKSEPPNAAQYVSAVLTDITFKPAEANWHTVSQRQTFEVTFNERGVSEVHLANTPDGLTVTAPRRLTEEVDIVGNRRLSKDEILAWIKTRPGDPYDADQVNQDLQALLKTGRFNPGSTRVTVDDAVRGGVRVMFEVFELPLIAEIEFPGPAGLKNRSAILNEFARHHVDIAWGRPFNVANLRKATKVIEEYFGAQGWVNVKAEALVEKLTDNNVKITFKITGTNF